MRRARRRSGAVGRRSSAIALIGVCLVVSAAAAQPARAAVLPAPNGFELSASNGFEIKVASHPAAFGRSSEVMLEVSRAGASAIYTAPATATTTSFAASFGSLGRIAVSYRPTGGIRTQASRCGQTASFASGYYEGAIEFHGEEGFADLSANTAPGSAPRFPCGGPAEVVGDRIAGVVLSAFSKGLLTQGSGFTFDAIKNHPAKSLPRGVNLCCLAP